MAPYPPQPFTTYSMDAAIDIARATKFATIIHSGGVPGDGGALTTVHAPFTVVEGPRLVGHIARNNPLFETLQKGSASVRLIFLPADGYVSPRVYAEKANSGRVVPTWNYVAAHLDGELALAGDAAALLDILNTQSDDYEGATDGTWRVGDAPDDYINAMTKAIAGITFTPKSGLVVKKLSQNRPGDLPAITEWIAASADPARTVAYWMKR